MLNGTVKMPASKWKKIKGSRIQGVESLQNH